ncbi:hypothetical protein EDB80DRAFT_863792 [Ilyonectria destructans]|nr:hypothetical protein EDB80DRAFT_863792 [Ilyonectria destructans]
MPYVPAQTKVKNPPDVDPEIGEEVFRAPDPHLRLEGSLQLAGSRRGMFRPLPMNFSAINIPYYLDMNLLVSSPKMTEDGFVQETVEYNVRCLRQWLESMTSNDPKIIPSYL